MKLFVFCLLLVFSFSVQAEVLGLIQTTEVMPMGRRSLETVDALKIYTRQGNQMIIHTIPKHPVDGSWALDRMDTDTLDMTISGIYDLEGTTTLGMRQSFTLSTGGRRGGLQEFPSLTLLRLTEEGTIREMIQAEEPRIGESETQDSIDSNPNLKTMLSQLQIIGSVSRTSQKRIRGRRGLGDFQEVLTTHVFAIDDEGKLIEFVLPYEKDQYGQERIVTDVSKVLTIPHDFSIATSALTHADSFLGMTNSTIQQSDGRPDLGQSIESLNIFYLENGLMKELIIPTQINPTRNTAEFLGMDLNMTQAQEPITHGEFPMNCGSYLE